MSSTCSCAFLLRLRCASAPSRLARAGSTTKRLESRAQDHREKEFLFKHSHVRVARCAGPHRRAPLSARARPQTCFNLIDIDGSGSITLAEFQKFGFIFNISTKVRTRARQCGRAWLTMRPCAGLPGSLPRVRRRQQQRAGLHRVPDVLPGAPACAATLHPRCLLHARRRPQVCLDKQRSLEQKQARVGGAKLSAATQKVLGCCSCRP